MAAWTVMFMLMLLISGNVENCLPEERYVIKELQKICKQRGLSFIHQNIRGLQSNFEGLQATLANHNIDVITLSETHLTNEPGELFSIDGYELITRNRTNGKGGGVCIYIKDGITWERRKDLEIVNNESIWIEIFFQKLYI